MKKTVAAVSSVVWSALLTVMKFIVGIITGSLGILSEALHSALDLLAALGSLVAVRIAARPADDEHPYGHGKVENLMALVETLLLLATAAWVVKEAVNRLLSDSPEALHVETSIWAFAVVIVSLVVDINRSAMLKRIAKETKSAALEADAAHFASDIWSSAAVLLGITGAACVGFTQEGTTLHWLLLRADVLASLGVVLLILHICRELGVKAINNLMDKANSETAEKILALMKTRMPAYRVTRLRAREVGMKVYTEIEVAVPQELHIDTAHEIADAIEELIASLFAEAETIVHMQPGAMPVDTPELLIRLIALTHRFGIHGLVLR
ncbi:MAG: cation transporter, partial [Akkermansia sp.]|nr:cation transporter [Akkermansia sp.]